jgi:hypothetical protein
MREDKGDGITCDVVVVVLLEVIKCGTIRKDLHGWIQGQTKITKAATQRHIFIFTTQGRGL